MKTRILTLILFAFCIVYSYSNVVVINGLTHVYSGSSGETIKGEVILLNSSEDEQRVTFDLSEAIFSCTSDRIFSKDNSHDQSSTNWFEGNLMERILAPKEKYVYRFNIAIPNNEELKGSFWSMLMVNIEKPIRKETKGNIGIDTKVRYAIGLLTNVNSYEEINLEFEDINLKEDINTAKKELEVKILNESLFVEGTRLSLEVYNKDGVKVHEAVTGRNMVFPGFCKNYKIDISELKKGEYECVLLADSREEFFGTNISLTIK